MTKKNCNNKKPCKNNKNCKNTGSTCSKKSGKLSAPVVVEAIAATAPAPTPVETKTEEATVTAARIQKNADTFYSLYDRYNTLRELARVLNGLPQNNPLPENAKIEKIEMSFTVNEKAHSVVMADVRIIGEVAPLIANTLSTFIELMHQEIFTLNTASAAMQQAIENTILRRDAAQQAQATAKT